jgi:hypothetical protein
MITHHSYGLHLTYYQKWIIKEYSSSWIFEVCRRLNYDAIPVCKLISALINCSSGLRII